MADQDFSLSDVGNARISQPSISIEGKNRLTHGIEKVSLVCLTFIHSFVYSFTGLFSFSFTHSFVQNVLS